MNTQIITRMEQDMQLLPARHSFNEGGGLSQRTQETYLYRAKKIIEYFNKPPEQITNEELRKYFLYLNNEKNKNLQ
ncbi:hypothetical protein BMS3Abin03_01490 [bacterium BMS3Abin03]|nr:hypothetical protein BMS3Abin03_01490 [bacterium BMS3Abin03]